MFIITSRHINYRPRQLPEANSTLKFKHSAPLRKLSCETGSIGGITLTSIRGSICSEMHLYFLSKSGCESALFEGPYYPETCKFHSKGNRVQTNLQCVGKITAVQLSRDFEMCHSRKF